MFIGLYEVNGTVSELDPARFGFVDQSLDTTFFTERGRSQLPWRGAQPNTREDQCVKWVSSNTNARTWDDASCTEPHMYICRRPCQKLDDEIEISLNDFEANDEIIFLSVGFLLVISLLLLLYETKTRNNLSKRLINVLEKGNISI